MNDVMKAARAARDEDTAAAMVAWYAASGCAMYPADAAVCREVWPALWTSGKVVNITTGGRVYAFTPYLYRRFRPGEYTVTDIGAAFPPGTLSTAAAWRGE